MKVIVIGAGPSGMMSALRASKDNEVIIVDSNNVMGKKLLLTGNGKCNYWNSQIDVSKYITDDKNILNSILTNDNINNTLNYLYEIGLYPTIKDGLYYPYSENSHSVLSILSRKLEENKVKFISNFKVAHINKNNNKFIVTSEENNSIDGDVVIVATGGNAMPKTGSDGQIMGILKEFGHEVIPFIPSLNRINLGCNFKSIENIRCKASIKVLVENEEIFKDRGEILFKEDGISGIVSFNSSAYVSYYLNKNKNVDISINFLNNIENVKCFLDERSELLKNPTLEDLLESILDYRIIFYLLNYIGLSKDRKYNSLSKEDKENLIEVLTDNKYKALSIGNMETSQVSIGGLKLTNINLQTFESIKEPNLYVIGEALDVAGLCGGYNIAFAFISGYIVGGHLC